MRMGAVVLVLFLSTTAKAVGLVVMGVNTSAIPGEKVFTIGVQIQEADLTAAGTRENPPLFVQNITLGDASGTPLQFPGLGNESNLQSIQSKYLDPASVAGPAADLGSRGNDALYRDSWWYSGSSLLDSNSQLSANAGILEGVVDRSGHLGAVTSNPAADGSGVYAIGPAANLGALGYTFSSFPGATANPTDGQAMVLSGLYGPMGSNILTHGLLADQFVDGMLTVPLAQIVASANIAIPSDWAHGIGTGIIIGQRVYNVLGGPADVDPGAFLDYATNSIGWGNVAITPDTTTHSTPEPSSWTLGAGGCICLAIARLWASRRAQQFSSETIQRYAGVYGDTVNHTGGG